MNKLFFYFLFLCSVILFYISCTSLFPVIKYEKVGPQIILSIERAYVFGKFILDPVRYTGYDLFREWHHKASISFENVKTGRRFSVEFTINNELQIFSIEPGEYKVYKYSFVYYFPNPKNVNTFFSEPAEYPELNNTFIAEKGTACYLGTYFADPGLISTFEQSWNLAHKKQFYGSIIRDYNLETAVKEFRAKNLNSSALRITEFQ